MLPIPKENPDTPASRNQGSQIGTELNDLKQRVKRNHTRVRYTRQVVDYLLRMPESQDCIKALNRILHCSDFLSFHHYYQKGKVKLASASFCKVPQICSQCAQRRATKYAQAILQSVQANPSKHLYLVTLTVRNSHDLADALSRLYNYFNILNQRFFKKNKADSITKRFLGGVWTIEFTYDKKTGWHPHIHGLIATAAPLYTHEVRKEWESISGGDSFMCDATEIKATDEQSLWSAVAEVSKYTLKNASMPPVQLLQVYKAIKGKQLIRRFGILKGKDVTYEGDLTEYENEPFFRFTFRYFDDAYKFQDKMHLHFDNHAQYKEYINEHQN
jgi:hypothetical protein